MRAIISKALIFSMLFLLVTAVSVAQTKNADENKEAKESPEAKPKVEEPESFGKFVEKVGKGIWARFNDRFNLEGAGKELINKKDQILSPFQKEKEVENLKIS